MLLKHFDPVSLNWLQMIAVLVLSAVAVLTRPRREALPRSSGDPVAGALFGCFGCVVFGMRNVGIDLTNATTGSVVVRTEVAMVMLLSFVVLKVKPDVFGWIGAAMLFVGAYLSLDIKLGLAQTSRHGARRPLLASAAAIAINALIIKTKFGGVSNSLTVGANSLVQTICFRRDHRLNGRVADRHVAAFADPGLVLAVGLGAALHLWRALPLLPVDETDPHVDRPRHQPSHPADHRPRRLDLARIDPHGHGQILGLITVTIGAGMVIPCLVKGAQPKTPTGGCPIDERTTNRRSKTEPLPCRDHYTSQALYAFFSLIPGFLGAVLYPDMTSITRFLQLVCHRSIAGGGAGRRRPRAGVNRALSR